MHLGQFAPTGGRDLIARASLAVAAQAPESLVQVDEQQAAARVDQDVAQAREHAVAVVVGKRQLGGPGDAH
jgi:hypothetical protein